MVWLHELTVGDSADAWRAGGFDVVHDRVTLDSVTIACAGDGAGHDRLVIGHEPPVVETVEHPNHVVGLDHVVVRSPDLDRTTEALGRIGLELRRIRDVPLREPIQQRFFRFANTIVELVGPPEPAGSDPAAVWGVALVVDDIDATAAVLGDACSSPKDAVQPGRRIATLRTDALGIGPTVAFMTPHVRRSV